DPEDGEAYYALGRTLLTLRGEGAAAGAFERALPCTPRPGQPAFAENHPALAPWYAALGNDAGARRELETAIRMKPDLMPVAEQQPRFAGLRATRFWEQLRTLAGGAGSNRNR